ncbi:MAG: NCS2 family permease [Fusobacterium sp.]|nr:NCS2 family permease [Fusobacterium sp.]
MTINDILAALGVVLNGIPQALLAASYGFASVPTAFGFMVGALACLFYGSAIPISFQAETIALAGMLGKDIKERLSMIFFAGLIMFLLGVTGVLSAIVTFAGTNIINAMMAGVGIMLTRISLQGLKESKIVTASSIISAFITYFFFGQNLVYTIVVCVIFSSLIANIFRINFGGGIVENYKKIEIKKPVLNFNVIRGALALACLTIGANIAFGNITASMTNGYSANIDQLTIYSGLADAVSALFGGGPVEAIISATGASPNPLKSGILMMIIMAIILILGLLPKISKFIPGHSVHGFLFILGAVVTTPTNTALAFSNGTPEDYIISAAAMTVTAANDPFIGLLVALVVKYIFILF